MATGVTPSSPAKAKKDSEGCLFCSGWNIRCFTEQNATPRRGKKKKKKKSQRHVLHRNYRQKMKIFSHVSVRSEAWTKVLDLWATLTRACLRFVSLPYFVSLLPVKSHILNNTYPYLHTSTKFPRVSGVKRKGSPSSRSLSSSRVGNWTCRGSLKFHKSSNTSPSPAADYFNTTKPHETEKKS